MLFKIIDLFSAYLSGGLYEYILIYLVPLSFLAICPVIIRKIIELR